MRIRRWQISNLIAKAGLKEPKQWKAIYYNHEVLIVRNSKTGAVREIPLDGKEFQRLPVDPAEQLVRTLRARR
jgi:hypothetical protein